MDVISACISSAARIVDQSGTFRVGGAGRLDGSSAARALLWLRGCNAVEDDDVEAGSRLLAVRAKIRSSMMN